MGQIREKSLGRKMGAGIVVYERTSLSRAETTFEAPSVRNICSCCKDPGQFCHSGTSLSPISGLENINLLGM